MTNHCKCTTYAAIHIMQKSLFLAPAMHRTEHTICIFIASLLPRSQAPTDVKLDRHGLSRASNRLHIARKQESCFRSSQENQKGHLLPYWIRCWLSQCMASNSLELQTLTVNVQCGFKAIKLQQIRTKICSEQKSRVMDDGEQTAQSLHGGASEQGFAQSPYQVLATGQFRGGLRGVRIQCSLIPTGFALGTLLPS